MMIEPIFWIKKMESLINNEVFQRETAQIRAKALFKEVIGEIPDYKWRYLISRLVRNIMAINFGLETLSVEMPVVLEELQNEVKQFALLWESLAKLEEGVNYSTALLNAAVTYEIAGYQANAACLARGLERKLFITEDPKISDFTSAFLQRYMLEIRRMASITKKYLTYEKVATSDYLKKIALAIAGEGFESSGRFFLTGNEEHLDKAVVSYEKSEEIYSSLGAIVESNIIRSIKSLLQLMKLRSTWKILKNIIENNDQWNRYLKLLARGVGSPVNESPSISELWPSQITALKNDLLSNTSKIIKMPTSAGKTRIAEIAMIHSLIITSGSKCVYIAPYRALVTELEQSFINIFGDMGFRISSLLGAYESDDFEEVLLSDVDILVLTPEKLDLLLRAQPEFLENVRLFVLDESQLIKEKERGVKFELLLTRLKKKLPKARFLFISAVIPTETLVDFANWFNANPERDILTSNWRPSIQRVAKFDWLGNTGRIQYVDTEDLEILQEFVTGIITSKQYKYRHPETGRYRRPKFPDVKHKGQIAAELAFKFCELGPVLVFCSDPKNTKSVGKALEYRLELSGLTHEKIPDCFRYNENIPSVIRSKEWLGEEHIVTRLLKRGIAIHHGNIPEVVRNSIEKDFRDRLLTVIIATTTLGQGVNLPIRTVVVHSCWIYSEGFSTPIPAIDYWNIAGRAGRAGKETEGTILHIIINRNDEKVFNYYLAHRKELEGIRSALFKLLSDLIDERLSETALEEKLNPEILALLVEEKEDMLTSEGVQNLLDGTLVQKQANRMDVNIDKLRNSMLNTAKNISEKISDPDLLNIYSCTGLSTSSCIEISNKINKNREFLETLLKEANSGRFEEVLDTFLEICVPLPEMELVDVDIYYRDLLMSWINGTDINEIISEFSDIDTPVEDLVKFIENVFSYRLPWGMTAFLKIVAKELEIEDEISEYCRFFPTMVKYGVPTPEASWVMSTGVPSRKVGMKIALQYIKESIEPSYQNFFEWLGSLDPEILMEKFDLKGSILEDVNKIIQRSAYNPLLKAYPNSINLLPIETDIKGLFVEDREIIALKAGIDSTLELQRDYYNSLDRNAIKILSNGKMIGYLDRSLAQVLALDIDCGINVYAIITDIEKGDIKTTSKVKIRLELA